MKNLHGPTQIWAEVQATKAMKHNEKSAMIRILVFHKILGWLTTDV